MLSAFKKEYWLGVDNVTMLNLENYKMTFSPKSCCAHSGLIICNHKQFECRVMTEVVVHASGWENLCVKVSHRKPQSKIYVLCNIHIESRMKLLMVWDLLKINRHYCKYFDKIIAHGLFPKVTLPTRICESSSTLIDNIFTDNIDKVGTSGILLNLMSDHQMCVYIG